MLRPLWLPGGGRRRRPRRALRLSGCGSCWTLLPRALRVFWGACWGPCVIARAALARPAPAEAVAVEDDVDAHVVEVGVQPQRVHSARHRALELLGELLRHIHCLPLSP